MAAAGAAVNTLYRHTQPGWVIAGVAVALPLVFLVVMPRESAVALAPVAVVSGLVLLLFGVLTVTVNREAVRLRFGVGLIRKTVPLTQVRSWRPVRNPWYAGWGIRLGPGWTLWNVSGLSAVELALADGRRLRIGTDEPEALSRAIGRNVGHPPADPSDVPPVPPRSWKAIVLVAAAVVVAMALVIGVTFHLEMIPPRVIVSARGFEIRSVFYGQEYPWSDVTEIRLEPRLPGILARTNGFAASGVLRGHFRVRGLGAGKLFVDLGTPPFVLVRLREGFVFVNLETAEETRALYDDLVHSRPVGLWEQGVVPGNRGPSSGRDGCCRRRFHGAGTGPVPSMGTNESARVLWRSQAARARERDG
jgi:hypothetical protein